MLNCENCGTENKDGAKFCKSCGSSISVNANSSVQPGPAMLCKNCLAELTAGAKFCKKCGTSVAGSTPSASSETHGIDIHDEIFKDSVPLAQLDLSASSHDALTELSLDLDEISPATLDLDGEPAQAALSSSPAPSLVQAIEVPAATEVLQTEVPVSKPVELDKKSNSPDTVIPGDIMKASMPASQLVAIAVSLLLLVSVLAGGYFWFSPGSSLVATTETVQADSSAIATASASASESAPSASAPIADTVVSSATGAKTDMPGMQNPPIVASSAAQMTTAPEPAAASVPVALAQNAKKNTKKKNEDDFDDEEDFDEVLPASGKRQRNLNAQHQEFSRGMHTPFGSGMSQGQVAALLARSDSFLANGDYDRAIATAQSALALDPNNAAAKARIKKARRLQGE